MSDESPNLPKPPTVKTSAVPLKKETVRITLRPSAPPSEPLAPVAPPPPTAQVPLPPAASAAPPPRPPAPTIPLRTGAPPAPSLPGAPPRPTGPLGPPPVARPAGGPPPAPTGSKTIPLQPQGGARPTTPVGRQTTRLTGAPATQPLPKATVKLQKTQPVASSGPPTAAISSAPIRTAQFDDDDDTDKEAGLNGMSIVALLGSIAALLIALMSWQKITPFNALPLADDTAKDQWQKNEIESSPIKLPVEYNPFHTSPAEGQWINNYQKIRDEEHALPDRGKDTEA